jgi:hypothetical protein
MFQQCHSLLQLLVGQQPQVSCMLPPTRPIVEYPNRLRVANLVRVANLGVVVALSEIDMHSVVFRDSWL